mmetsp:Transcript_38130/g.38512  ORF Transcript_38130/g.38512 Transcript_38130/m.38512 type:complete len:97 (-) Transcript_38130:27-317(-)
MIILDLTLTVTKTTRPRQFFSVDSDGCDNNGSILLIICYCCISPALLTRRHGGGRCRYTVLNIVCMIQIQLIIRQRWPSSADGNDGLASADTNTLL